MLPAFLYKVVTVPPFRVAYAVPVTPVVHVETRAA